MTQEELMKDLEDKEKDALDTYTQGYTEAVDALDKGYANVDATLAAGQTMLENANKEQLDYTIDEIERQKAQTQKDYAKEQKAAYVDYQKQVDPYGVNAERMVSAGLDNSGFAESSKVAMYNQYQQRVAVARESMQRSIAEYNASMTQARVSNSVAMAQLAYETLMKKMQYATEHMLKRNDLLITMTEGQAQIKQNATKNWLATLAEMNDLPISTDTSLNLNEGADADYDGAKTFNKVRAYLLENGASEEMIGGLKTRKEFRNSKEKERFGTYKKYLEAYLAYVESTMNQE